MTRTFTTSFAMLLAATACDVDDSPSEPALSLRSTPSAPELEETYCAAKRQLALVSVSQCPTVTGWSGSVAFPNVGGELGKFCKYDWSGQGSPNVGALQAASGVVGVASDCGSVFDHSTDAVWDAVGPDIEAAFHEGIGLATADDLSLSTSEGSRSKVYVAVVDSVPEPKPALPRSRHGEFVVSLIEDIACPGGTQTCAVDVVRSLGLPRYIGQNGVPDLVDTTHGGNYGSQVDIARAIYDAVETWKATDLVANPSKLIINLSVGWDRQIYGDVDDPGPRPSVAAVYAAIQYARCHPDVIVIAAAGNRSYTCGEGPVAPGAWEQQPMPSANRCAALNAPTPPGGVGYAPLVYSIGGLNHDFEPMARTRFDGMPRLAALATNAVTGNASRTVTGTSGAAGVASGAAALVWSYNPHLSASAVMSVIYNSGNEAYAVDGETTLEADYALPNTSNLDVRAIDVCAALEAACNLSSSSCPAVPFATPLACLEDEPSSLDNVFTVLANSIDHTVTLTNVGEEIPCDNECTDYPTGMRIGNGAEAECPEPISIGQPYTLPQPTQIGCPNCTLAVTASLVYASLDPQFEEADLTDVTVAVVGGNLKTTYFRFGDIDLYVGTITSLEIPSGMLPTSVHSATISLTFDGYAAPIVDPLLLGS